MIPIAEAAELMETTELNVLMHVKRGHITAEEKDGEWYINADSLITFQENNGKKVKVHKSGSCGGCNGGC
jgi:predicted alpha/beta hydrolase family esterase